jgi:hypothetical protein
LPVRSRNVSKRVLARTPGGHDALVPTIVEPRQAIVEPPPAENGAPNCSGDPEAHGSCFCDALSRRKQGFESPRERQQNQRLRRFAAVAKISQPNINQE